VLRRTFKNRKRRVAAASGTLALCAALAFAAWLVDGQGPGRGQVGQLQAIVVEAGATAADSECFPGELCAATFTITNPNSQALEITSVADIPGDPFNFISGTCAALSVPGTAVSPPIALPPGGPHAITIPDVFALAADAETGCQGAEFTKNVNVGAQTP
jgi:hypothetical protein